MADDQAEWIKLPPDEKCVHKQWKARVAGYEEAYKLFNRLDEKSPEFTKFLGILKKMCTDINAIAQEKALGTVLAFVENAHVAGRSCGEVMAVIVTKCVNASRAKTKEKALEIIQMYIEIDKHEQVQEELMKGLENKQPKVVFACLQAFRTSLEVFGLKVIAIKPLVKVLPKLLEDRDMTVRDESKMLAVEMFRWIGAALRPHLANLKPVQLSELETEFENLPPGKPTQTRFMRSQHDMKAKAEAAVAVTSAGGGDDGEADDDDGAPAVEIDPLELIDPVEILSKLPKTFYEQIEAKKWQERREMLEAVEILVTKNPKLLPGEYGDLVRALKKVLSKDTNVMLVALAAKCLTGLANGLKKKFSPYASQCSEAILVKFKEKKPMVVAALRECIDAIYPSTSLEPLTEELLTALADKNPSVKAEASSFIARCFTKATTTTLTKKILKPFIEPLSKTINDTAPEVREAAFDALGTAMKVVSEKVMTALLGDVDPLKMARIKECCEKAQLVNMKAKASAKPTAPAPKAVTRPPTAAAKSAAASRPGSAPKAGAAKPAGAKKGAAKGKKPAMGPGGDVKPAEPFMSDEVVAEKVNALLGEETVNNLANSNWKERLAAMESIEQEIKRTPKEDMATQAVVRTIGAKKPGLKDNNFQVLKLRLSALSYLAENFNFSWTSVECILPDLVDRIGDMKNGQGCKDVLTAAAEATEFPKITGEVVKIAFEGKNPKNQSESLNWLAQAIYDFGFKVNIKPLVANLKKALAATNPAVRQAGITLLGVCYMYMGAPLRVLFEDEKPALLAQIDAEFEKVRGQKPPAPVRGLKGAGDAGGDEEEEEVGDDAAPADDLIPRNDISERITDELLAKLADKNWKIRKEGLDEVIAILSEAKFVTSNLGGLPEALKLRLADSNKILVTTTLGIMRTIATSSGPHCKRHVPIIAGPLLSTMGDTKPMVRQAATTALNSWVEHTKLAPFIETGVFAESLRIENPYLRSTLLGWLAEKLKDQQKKLPVEIKECLLPLLMCLNDRNADVRKAAQEAILPFMIQTGFDSMLKAASKVDKSSKDGVVALLEKAKSELPSKPQKVRSVPVVQSHISTKEINEIMNDQDEDEEVPAAAKASKTVKGGKPAAAGKKTAAVRGKNAAPSTSKRNEVEVDGSPIMSNTYTKAQRLKDEKTLKVLKWNFTAPRLEFYEQLRDQMEKNFSASIMELLLHKDFQKHIKAIQMLSTALRTCRTETLANVDLILKWFTLRFFETNPSMLNKALEYLHALFEVMAEEDQRLTANEADAFIPYLVLKVGDSKENVRREVRKLFKSICCVYPISKMVMYIMGGLASKNTKQRAECLDELGCMMETAGLDIFQPSPKEALKEIAKQIANRDNSVRSAALNTIVVAYQHMGDQVYNCVGKLNDKDLGMLEERIKRAARSKPAVPVEVNLAPVARGTGKGRPSTAPSQTLPSKSNDAHPQARPSTSGNPSAQPRVPPQTLPPQFLITTTWEPDPRLLTVPPETLSEEHFQELMKPFPLPVLKTRNLRSTPPKPANQQSYLLEQSPDAKGAVDLTITNIASGDLATAAASLSQLSYTASESRHQTMIKSSANQIVTMVTLQLKLLHTRHLGDADSDKDTVFKVHTMCTSLLMEIAIKDMLASISMDVFKDLLHQMISSILDPRLEDYPEGVEIISQLNLGLAKVLMDGHQTNTLCAALYLLHDCAGTVFQCTDSFTELVQKCIWKKTRNVDTNISRTEMGPVLKICNSFINDYPPVYWESQSSAKPLRTVKTLIAKLIQCAPERVYTAISVATFSPKNDLEAYIQKHMTKLSKSTNDLTSNTTQSTPGKMAAFIHNSLATIFKKIGSRENSKEGIKELYQFREKYPDASLEPFLKKSSSFFQMYIERGLKSIEDEKKKEASAAATKFIKGSSAEGSADSGVNWDEKLRQHRERMKRLGIGAISSSTGNLAQSVSRAPPDVVLSTRTSNVMEDVLPRRAADDRPSAMVESSSRSELMDLKARLDRIKKSTQS